MLKDIFQWSLAAVGPFLIVLKNDKQMVHLLEGKLFKRGGDISVAKAVFSRHKKTASVFLFACGCWLAVAGLVMLGTGAAGVAVAVCGGICILLGVFGRMRSFLAAEKELG
jgi:hypothetical protein